MTNDSNRALMDAAGRLFRERGYSATPLRDIATAAGMLPGSLHYRFPSKESLLRELMVRGTERALAEVSAATAVDPDPIRAIRNAIRAHLRLLLEGGDAAYVLLYDFRSLSGEDRAAVVVLRDAYEALWNGLLHSAAGAGLIKSDVNLQLTRHMLLGAINWTAQWYRRGGKLSVDDVADQYLDTMFRGLLP
jgi:TetR/AcrR family transcriptional regulator, cholesterol catabolism regulator